MVYLLFLYLRASLPVYACHAATIIFTTYFFLNTLIRYSVHEFLGRSSDVQTLSYVSLMSHRACCYTFYTIQLMHYSHFKTFKTNKMLTYTYKHVFNILLVLNIEVSVY